MQSTNYFPIFSVVIPMYNVGRYIEQSIQSVLDQSFSNFEVICVDDGCTDDTLEKLMTFDDQRIRVVSQENRGLSGARNTGIHVSKGLYIALLDADDFWARHKLERHFEHLKNNPELGVSYSASAFVDEQGQCLGIGQNPKLQNITPKDIFCRNPIGNGSAPVIRRATLNQIAQKQIIKNQMRTCYFDEQMRQSEDIECWLRIALDTSWRFAGIDEQLTYYRVNSGGLSANLDNQFAAWQFAVEKNRYKHSTFFKRWYSLAEAYQKRYLARRATQSGNYNDAIRLIHEAISGDIRILKEEPVRTFISCLCAYLSLLPGGIYERIQSLAMQVLGRHRIS